MVAQSMTPRIRDAISRLGVVQEWDGLGPGLLWITVFFMCGRFTVGAPTEAVLAEFGLGEEARALWEALTPRYNVAPTQTLPVVRLGITEQGEDGSRRILVPMRWGLVPSWAEDVGMGSRLINARVETVASKPAFRAAFRRRRCLVPATGFFEWSRSARGPKQPWLVRRKDRELFAFAGLFETWNPPAESTLVPFDPVVSFTILTGPPNDVARPIHDRMPVILPESSYGTWLDPASARQRLEDLLVSYPGEEMEAVAVSRLVNNPRNEDPSCIRPLDEGAPSRPSPPSG